MAECFDCKLGRHASCREWEDCDCSHSTIEVVASVSEPEPVEDDGDELERKERDYSDTEREAAIRYVEDGSEGWSRKGKRDRNIKDPHSTGRKRAAILFPLLRSEPCEWQNASVRNPMGGGPNPITFGCDNLQSHRHHGPDKNTLNNSEGNVHRICTLHHNNWHSQNDKIMSEEK